MTIKQFNASYLIPDDRLLFRISTVDDSEYRFWMTRRVVLFILAATNHLLYKKLEERHTPEAAIEMMKFGQEVATAGQTDAEGKLIEIPYQAANKYPIGVDPILVMDVKCEIAKDGIDNVLMLDLILPAGGIMNLKMAGNTLHSMCALLSQLAEHASWGAIGSIPQIKTHESSGSKSDENLDPLVH